MNVSYEIQWAMDNGFGWCIFSYKEDANKLYKHLRKKPTTPIRARVVNEETGEVLSERVVGTDQTDWYYFDCNYRTRTRDAGAAVERINMTFLSQEFVAEFSSRHEAFRWIASEAQTDPKFGKEYFYTVV
jgi:hypothetical protein